jgi:hypothetical protein
VIQRHFVPWVVFLLVLHTVPLQTEDFVTFLDEIEHFLCYVGPITQYYQSPMQQKKRAFISNTFIQILPSDLIQSIFVKHVYFVFNSFIGIDDDAYGFITNCLAFFLEIPPNISLLKHNKPCMKPS